MSCFNVIVTYKEYIEANKDEIVKANKVWLETLLNRRPKTRGYIRDIINANGGDNDIAVMYNGGNPKSARFIDMRETDIGVRVWTDTGSYEFELGQTRSLPTKNGTYVDIPAMVVLGQKAIGSIDVEGDFGISLGEAENFNIQGRFSEITEGLFEQDIKDKALSEEEVADLRETKDFYIDKMVQAGFDQELTVEWFRALKDKQRKDDFTETRGQVKGGKIDIALGETSQFFSKAEVFLHEVQHALIEGALKQSGGNRLRKRIRVVQDATIAGLEEFFGKGEEYRVFLMDKEGLNDPDAELDATNEQVIMAKKIYNYAFLNEDNPESEFLAYATTNKAVKFAMEGMEVKANDKMFKLLDVPEGKEPTRFVAFINKLIEAFNAFYSKLKFKDAKGKQLAVDLLGVAFDAMLNKAKDDTEPELDDGIKIIYSKYEAKVKRVTDAIDEKINGVRGANIKKNRGIADWVDKITNVKGLIQVKNSIITTNAFGKIFTDTTKEKVSWFYQMLRASKQNIDSEIQNLKKAQRNVLNSTVGLELVEANKKEAAKRVLIDTDAGVLGTIKDTVKLLANPNAVKKEIEALKKELGADVYEDTYNLGRKLVTGVFEVKNGFINASEIARKHYGVSNANRGKIDRLASLIALEQSGEANKKLTLEALLDHPDKFQAALNTYTTYNKQLVSKLYFGKNIMLEKGFTNEAYLEDKMLYAVPESQLAGMQKLRATVIKELPTFEGIVGEKYYLISYANTDTSYTEGLISTVQLKSEGMSFRGLMTERGVVTEDIDNMVALMAEDSGKGEDGYEMAPVRDDKGVITDYRLVASKQDKYEHLGLDNDIVETVVSTLGNINHKEKAFQNNIGAVNAMLKHYNKTYEGNEEEFVELRPSTKEEIAAGKPYKYSDSWARIPGYTKQYIFQHSTRGNSIFIPKSLLTDFIGYKDVSIQNLPFIKDRAATKIGAATIEKAWMEIISRYKSLIVVTMANTFIGNYESNAVVTMAEAGIGPVDYAKRFGEHWENLNKYHEDHNRLLELEALRDAGSSVNDVEIERLKAVIAENPATLLVEDGQYSTILEDISTLDSRDKKKKDGIIQEKLDKLFERLPDGMEKVRREVYLDSRSTAYAKLLKLTQYSDIVNRLIIHEAFMEKGTMTERDSLNYVDQIFVNYSYLDNKYLKWGNDAGPVFFTKYLFRSTVAVGKSIARKPLLQGMLQAGQSVTGVDLEQPMDNYFDFINSLLHRMGPAFDPEDMFGALVTPNLLNPIFK